MIEISDALFQTFAADVARRQFEAFAAWWQQRSDLLPAAPRAGLERLWRYAVDRGRELGIDNDDEGRLSLYAAAFGLMGELDARLFIEVSDLLFEPGTRDERLPRVAALAPRRVAG